jgi:hypothetical protein
MAVHMEHWSAADNVALAAAKLPVITSYSRDGLADVLRWEQTLTCSASGRMPDAGLAQQQTAVAEARADAFLQQVHHILPLAGADQCCLCRVEKATSCTSAWQPHRNRGGVEYFRVHVQT